MGVYKKKLRNYADIFLCVIQITIIIVIYMIVNALLNGHNKNVLL